MTALNFRSKEELPQPFTFHATGDYGDVRHELRSCPFPLRDVNLNDNGPHHKISNGKFEMCRRDARKAAIL
ncbi:unnamed protein product [Toxocara canis]|uniref:Uncharacterized protein n=1 Tax=Toxocara canis TaxID=6265 RepID=A0A183V7W8_TOXCA|nr:unnamed protein product [Toxocara canis]